MTLTFNNNAFTDPNGQEYSVAGLKLYKCDCGWIGPEDKMMADCSGEMWSNWICPECRSWYRLDDYELINPASTG